MSLFDDPNELRAADHVELFAMVRMLGMVTFAGINGSRDVAIVVTIDWSTHSVLVHAWQETDAQRQRSAHG